MDKTTSGSARAEAAPNDMERAHGTCVLSNSASSGDSLVQLILDLLELSCQPVALGITSLAVAPQARQVAHGSFALVAQLLALLLYVKAEVR